MLIRSWKGSERRCLKAIQRPKWGLKLYQVTLHAFNLSSHPINEGLVRWSIFERLNDVRTVESAIQSPQLKVQLNQFMPQVINLDIRVHTKVSLENTISRVGGPALEIKCI